MLARNYSQSNNNRPVTSRDLEKILWVQTVSPAGLSQREKNAFYVLLAALRLCPKAIRIVSTIGELAAVHRRAGLPGSPATVRRALAGLEERGFLWRRRCRLGYARLGIELIVNRARWAYWTQTQVGKVVPIPKPPTSVYIPTRQSMGAGEDRTITQDVVNSRNVNINSSYARARGNNALYTWLSKHPVMLTLWCLLKGSQDMELFDRAKREVKALDAQQALDNPTGIPWEAFERHWDDMIPAVRESYAKSEILPKLREESPAPAPASCSAPPSQPDDPPATEEERARIRKLIEESIESTSLPDELAPAPAPAVSLLDDEMRILFEARERARERAKSRFIDG